MAESEIVASARLLSRGNVRLFRNSTGVLKDRNGRHVTYGLCVGSSDLIGFVSVTITPEMVGQKVAVFAALEAKGKTKATPEQVAFISMVKGMGGRAGVFHSDDEAKAILDGK